MTRKEYDPFALPYGAGWIEQKRNGTWLARWQEKYQTRSRSFPSQQLAHTFLLDQWTRRQQGRFIEADHLTVAVLVQQWIDRGDWKPSTVATYRQRARAHILPELGELLVLSLSRNRVQHWIDTMRRDGLSASTIHSAVHVLSASLRSAIDLGIIQDNPCERTRRPTARRTPVKVWTLADVQKVLAWLRTEHPTVLTNQAYDPDRDVSGVSPVDLPARTFIVSPMHLALYRLALTTGMRPGELRALQWRDIDFERSIVTIRRSMSKDSSGRTIVGTSTKTGRERMVVLTEATLSSLSQWKSEQTVTQLPGYVFTRPDGKWLALTSWQRDHRDLCQAAGVPEIPLHSLRHSTATIMLEQGVHPKIVSEILGHQGIQITLDTYSHVSPSMQKMALETVEQALVPTTDRTKIAK